MRTDSLTKYAHSFFVTIEIDWADTYSACTSKQSWPCSHTNRRLSRDPGRSASVKVFWWIHLSHLRVHSAVAVESALSARSHSNDWTRLAARNNKARGVTASKREPAYAAEIGLRERGDSAL